MSDRIDWHDCLSVRLLNVLQRSIESILDMDEASAARPVTAFSARYWLNARGFGARSLEELSRWLARPGLTLSPDETSPRPREYVYRPRSPPPPDRRCEAIAMQAF